MSLSEYKKMIEKLINSDLSSYQIHKDTGVSHNALASIRNGSREIDNLTLRTTEKLYEYAINHLKS